MFREPGSSRPEGDGANSRAANEGGRRRTRQVRPAGRPEGEGAQNGQGANNRRRRRSKGRNQPPQPPQSPVKQDSKKQPKGRDRRRVRPAGRDRVDRRAMTERHAETWWADRWLDVLNRFGWKGRILNGQRYAEEGRVVSFGLETGRIRAKVQGTRIDPYEVTIGLKPLPDADWDLVVEIMSCQALYTAQLLSGEMPQDVEDVFDAAQASLFPRYKDDITAHCNCPDMANPCKHIAAVYFMMAEAFDKDPFLIFHLRGRSRDALLAMLRAQRAAEAQAMPIAVETMDAGSLEPLRFWQAGEELDAVSIQIHQPPLPGGNARRLGRPPFWRSPADPITRLAEVYEAIGKRARDVAMGEPLVALEV